MHQSSQKGKWKDAPRGSTDQFHPRMWHLLRTGQKRNACSQKDARKFTLNEGNVLCFNFKLQLLKPGKTEWRNGAGLEQVSLTLPKVSQLLKQNRRGHWHRQNRHINPYKPPDRQTDRYTDRQTNRRKMLIDWLIYGLINWSIDWLIDRLIDWLNKAILIISFQLYLFSSIFFNLHSL
jgi:hypothetical protein